MRILRAVAIAPLLLLMTTVASCGSASRGGRPSSEAPPGYHDGDDSAVIGFGHPADPTDKQAISSLVRRYFDAAFVGDGRTACGLMDAQTARYVPAIERSSGSTGGNTCPAAMSKLFGENHENLAATFETTDVYVKEDQAYAIIGFPSRETRYIHMLRQKGTWAIDDTLGEPLS